MAYNEGGTSSEINPPPQGSCKLNVKGSSKGNPGPSGMGEMIKNQIEQR